MFIRQDECGGMRGEEKIEAGAPDRNVSDWRFQGIGRTLYGGLRVWQFAQSARASAAYGAETFRFTRC
jgi:hypothetical protein